MDRKEETIAVKRALSQAGYKAQVTHGTGTAWGWLTIKLLRKWVPNDSATLEKVEKIAMAVTGRNGDYDGRISVTYSF